MEKPLVTIVSPCYNHSKYIIESLESVRNQTYPYIDHIIIDDCSNDNSVELIEEWIKKNNYQCRFIKHNRNQGIANTFNESIELAKGMYWNPLSTDDYAFPGRTEELLNGLLKNPEYEMVVSDATFVDEHSQPIAVEGHNSFTEYTLRQRKDFNIATDSYGSFRSLLYGNYITGSLMITTKALREAGMFKKNLRIEDWEMWLRLAKRKHFLYINKILMCYRSHASNSIKTDKKIPLDALKTILAQKQYCYRNGLQKEFDGIVLSQWYIAIYEKKYKFIIEILKVFPTFKLVYFTFLKLTGKPGSNLTSIY